MKNKLLLILCLALPLTSTARDIYKLTWRGKCFSSSDNGKVVITTYSEKEIIAKAAADNGLDPKTLMFAYVVGEENAEVVDATGATVAEIFQFEYHPTAVSNGDGSQKVRQAFIFNELHDDSIGSIFGTEASRRDGDGNLTRFTYRGTFHLIKPEENQICSGTFATGARIPDTTGN